MKENRASDWLVAVARSRTDRVKRFRRQRQQTLVTDNMCDIAVQDVPRFQHEMGAGSICMDEEDFT